MKGRGFVFSLVVVIGAGIMAVPLGFYPFTPVDAAEETPIEETDADERELGNKREELTPDSAQDIQALKMLLQGEEEAAAALAGPRAPTVAPPNDTCAGTEVMSTTLPATSAVYDITDATTTGDPPVPGASCTAATTLSRSVWFQFTPAITGSYVFSACAAETASTVDDMVMAVYTSAGACSGPFTQQACDDDSCISETLQPRITKTLTAGAAYYIVIWKANNTAPTVGNESVQLQISNANVPANDTCAGSIPLLLNRPVQGTLTDSANDYQLAAGSPCFPAGGVGQTASTAPGNDVVYSFTAPSAGSYSFKAWNLIGVNPVLYLANTCPPATPGTPVTVACTNASNRGSLASEEINCVALSAGQQVFLFVDQAALAAGVPFFVQVENCPTQETEANNTPATADTFACLTLGSIVPAGDVDFFSLGTPAASSRIFAMVESGASAASDVDLRVTTTTDTLEYDDLNNDAPWGDLGPNIAGTITTGVATFLRINQFSLSSQTDPYRLYAVVQPASTSATAESESNNTTATADAAANNYFSGALPGPAPSTDVDVFEFTASAGDLIFVSLDGDPLRNNTPVNAKISLLDGNGALVIAANDTGATSSTTSGAGNLTASNPSSPSEGIIFRAPSTSVYYVKVEIGTTSTTAFGAGDYLLSISKNCTLGGGGGVPHPAINLVKLTNGTNNNTAPGPFVPVGSTVTFTYVVTNSGDVPLSGVTVRDDNGTPASSGDDFNATFTGGDTNGNGFLDLTETWTFAAARIATAGQYTNIGTASGNGTFGTQASDTDPENHFGATPGIHLVKFTNGTNNDSPPGPTVPLGSTVTFTYVVTNTGNVPLSGVTVRDNNGTPGSAGDDFTAIFQGGDTNANGLLDTTETFTFTAGRVATVGQYTNVGTASGTSPSGPTVTDTDPDNHFVPAPSPTPTPTPTPTPPTLLGNISTRLRVETGDGALIGGFIVTGSAPKKVIVRGIGTSLSFADKLANPILELHGPSGLIEANDNWVDSPKKQEIMDSGVAPSNDLESAIIATLPANGTGYTAILRGVNNGTGIGVVEAFDLDLAANSQLANISTRGFVQTDDNILIAGTFVVGPGSRKVLVRALGPSLSVPGKMGDPTLELRDENGSVVRANDNWRSDQEAEIMATGAAPPDNSESAIVETLAGNGAGYTAIVRGVNNTTGIAVVEIYALDN